MSSLLAGLIGLLIGLTVGGFVCFLVGRRSREQEQLAVTPALSQQLMAAVDLVRGAAIIVDAADHVLHATAPSRTSGLVRGNRIGEPGLVELVHKVRETGLPIGTSLAIPTDSVTAGTRELAVRAAPLENGLLLIIADDRSAQARADEIKRDFTANVSHELKTPVGALKVLAEAVEQAADDPKAVRHFASRMAQESDRLSELVRQIIELTRLQSADPLARADAVNLDDIVDVACARNQEAAASRNVTITQAGARDLRVLGDEEQLTSALSNLIQNAINYSDPGARVAVSTRKVVESDDEFVEISVADNGIGIRPEELERIFERFYRIDYARSRDSGGTGLGLSIVKHIMAAHGGAVNVWSKVGQGSTFTLRLPSLIEQMTDDQSGRPEQIRRDE